MPVPKPKKTITSISHSEDKCKNIPTAEYQSVVGDDTKTSKPYRYPRNTDLDPQLVWRGWPNHMILGDSLQNEPDYGFEETP